MFSAKLSDLKVKIFADGADKDGILKLAENPLIKGFTTNPTLMAKAGIRDYRIFAQHILSYIKDRPFSFEVFTDEISEMERQANEIAGWAKNVYVKIPITNTRGESTLGLVRKLSRAGVPLNITAILTIEQVQCTCEALRGGAPAIVSVFAGRIADTGRDPLDVMCDCSDICCELEQVELLWASTRELFNIFQAEMACCDIITVTHDILKKLPGVGKDLSELSLDTVRMFYKDAVAAGFKL